MRPRPALFVTSPALNAHTGLDLTLASETLQHTGSFKFRGAYNTAALASAPHLIATSSGNFGQALAFACRLHGKRCTVVMPHDSPAVKVDAVRAHGAQVELVTTRVTDAGRRRPRARGERGQLGGHPRRLSGRHRGGGMAHRTSDSAPVHARKPQS